VSNLANFFRDDRLEAGCDEAGRGCLAGPVVAAAVVLNPDRPIEGLNDSKKLKASQRFELEQVIKECALSWAVGMASEAEIDEINILKASFLAMHRAIEQLAHKPDFLLIDGNRFIPYPEIPHACIIKGDGKFQSIAAASILAKTHRDRLMCDLHEELPVYNWISNKGYPTMGHVTAIEEFGLCRHHRLSFRKEYNANQLKLSIQ
jgi:ribonuclease HII